MRTEEIEDCKNHFAKSFGTATLPKIVLSPGRVNLIGEHTDYNEGYVLPIAIDRGILVLGENTESRNVNIFSVNYDIIDSFSLDTITPSQTAVWSNYIRGIAKILESEMRIKLKGTNLLIYGNIPQGAGLSSSAALEVGTCYMFNILNNLNLTKAENAIISQKAENEFVGVQCGIMDQFIVSVGKNKTALFLDCRNLEYKHINLNLGDTMFVILDTGISRELVNSEYNKRRSDCFEGVAILKEHLHGINSLRDVEIDVFYKYSNYLPMEIRTKCQHVIFENYRVLESIEFLGNGDLEGFGKLLFESHRSLRDLFEVSSYHLDVLYQIGVDLDCVIGARMTGAGFGGCAIFLVKTQWLEEFKLEASRLYKAKTGMDLKIYPVTAEDGVKEVY